MEKLETLIETLHTLLCDKSHAGKMEDLIRRGRENSRCYYYLEKNLTERWELADHVFWKEEAEKLMLDLRASTAEEALRSIYKILDLIEKVNQLNENEYEFFTRLLPGAEDLPGPEASDNFD